jgi:hypothetical protein
MWCKQNPDRFPDNLRCMPIKTPSSREMKTDPMFAENLRRVTYAAHPIWLLVKRGRYGREGWGDRRSLCASFGARGALGCGHGPGGRGSPIFSADGADAGSGARRAPDRLLRRGCVLRRFLLCRRGTGEKNSPTGGRLWRRFCGVSCLCLPCSDGTTGPTPLPRLGADAAPGSGGGDCPRVGAGARAGGRPLSGSVGMGCPSPSISTLCKPRFHVNQSTKPTEC